jgi:hypothetical protein
MKIKTTEIICVEELLSVNMKILAIKFIRLKHTPKICLKEALQIVNDIQDDKLTVKTLEDYNIIISSDNPFNTEY